MYLEILWTISMAGLVYMIVSYLYHLSILKAKEFNKVFPPGPTPLPIIGNLNLLGKKPHITLKELSKKYGDVFSISLGSKRVVIINSIEPAWEALVHKGADFAGRPTDHYTAEVFSRGYKDILFSDYGPEWKTVRKIAHSSLKMYGTGMERLEKLMMKEIEELIKRLDAKIGQSIDPTLDLSNTVMNVICAIVFGSRYEFDDPEFIAVNKFMTLQTEGFTGTDAIAYLPWLRYLPIKSLKVGLDKLVRCTEIRDPILKKKLDEHRDSMTPETIRDFTDAILKEADNALKEDKSIKNYLTDDHLHMTLLDIFTAGADTTAVTLRWAFVFLCRNPQVQDKIHEELTKVVGSGRLPNLQDRGHLHFLEATMYEILRSSSVAYIGAPHRATRDADLQGFKIPKDTQLMINHWAINNDERYWDAPDEFRPERWLDANNCFTPGNHKSYLPFSAGRRGCIGESWAKTELFIILSQLMYRYKIIKARDKPLPSLEGIFGIVVAPVDFHIAVVHRCRIQDTN